MARTIVSLALFSTVALLAGAMTVSGLSFTADTVAKVAAMTPVKAQKRLPSYIAYMPAVKAEVLNIAKSVRVATRVPKTPALPLEALPAPTFTHTWRWSPSASGAGRGELLRSCSPSRVGHRSP